MSTERDYVQICRKSNINFVNKEFRVLLKIKNVGFSNIFYFLLEFIEILFYFYSLIFYQYN